MSVTVHIGDCRNVMRSMPADSVDCVVTSPPYWGLRDYGVDGQIGLEASVAEHIDVLRDVFREVRRVLKPDGTCWVNYGDAYASQPSWGRGNASSTLEGRKHGGEGGASADRVAEAAHKAAVKARMLRDLESNND